MLNGCHAVPSSQAFPPQCCIGRRGGIPLKGVLPVEVRISQSVRKSSSDIVEEGPYWWTLISDLRTVLEKHPLPVDELKALLGEAAQTPNVCLLLFGLLQPPQPDAVVIYPLDRAVQLPLNAV